MNQHINVFLLLTFFFNFQAYKKLIAKIIQRILICPSPSFPKVNILENHSNNDQNQELDIYTMLLTNLPTLFKFCQLSHYCSFSGPGSNTGSESWDSFSVFHDLDTFMEYRAIVLKNVP